jgi:Ni/Co efflux regulator RcnB
MLKMKKILAILLAVCFLVSITAASASANDNAQVVKKEKVVIEKTVVKKENKFRGEREEHKFGGEREEHKFRGDRDEHKFRGDRDEHKFRGEHHKKRHFHPGHWEKHKVPHKKFINQKYVYVYVYESVFVQGYWGFN